MVHSQEEWSLTDRQRAALESLVCERLSANPEVNLLALKAFRNGLCPEEEGVLGHLRCRGLSDDKQGETAVYIVKASDGTGLLAFSLKCSELFTPLSKDREAFMHFQMKQYFQTYLKDGIWPEAEKKRLFGDWWQIEKLRMENQFDKKKARVRDDAQNDRNKQNARVFLTQSGVLLVDFCKNDSVAAQQAWKALGMPSHRSVGEVLFWQFIVPIVLQVHGCVGCGQLFLFAADGLDENRKLMLYYEEILGFHEELRWGANKPVYDNYCWLMSMSVGEMCRLRQNFFSTFNRPRGLNGR